MPDVQAGFKKRRRGGRGTLDITVHILWVLECSKQFQKKVSLCVTDYSKAFDCVYHEKLWVALRQMEVPQHLIVLMHSLCRGEEPLSGQNGEMEWFPTGKGVRQRYILSACLFN